MKKHVPNALTMANLFCGCCALVYLIQPHGSIFGASFFILFSLVFDWLDGTVARLFNVQSPLGKELDSLADVISFGVVPGAIFFRMLSNHQSFVGDNGAAFSINILAFFAFVLSAFSALRLAKFNLDTRQTSYFLGLATPACTMFVLGLGLAWERDQFQLSALLGSEAFIFPMVAVLSFLLVSEIPMFALKLKKGEQASSASVIIGLVLVACAMVFLLKGIGLSLLMLAYIIGSMLFFRPKNQL